MEARCYDDLDLLGAETFSPLEDLDQDNYHRLIEPPGSNIDDPDRGLGLPGLLSGTTKNLESLAPRIEAELLKDPRNAEVTCVVTAEQLASVSAWSYLITIRCVPDPDELGITVTDDLIMRLRATQNGLDRVEAP